MLADSIRLKILLPYKVFAVKEQVLNIVAETEKGSCGFLPNRLDCIAPLVPGILMYKASDEGETFVAVDQGILVKTGPEVVVSVRHAIGGVDLGQLESAVKQQFLDLDERVGDRELRKIKARKEVTRSIWEGFAMFGIIGWSVAIPTLVGVAIGLWLDSNYPSKHSWTLTMIVIGVVAECVNAWHWVSEENRNINKEE